MRHVGLKKTVMAIIYHYGLNNESIHLGQNVPIDQ